MLSTPAFLLSLLPCVATSDWDFLRSGAGAESGTNLDVSASIKAAVLFAASSFGLLLTGIVQGGLLIPLLARRLRLFQTLPLLNCGLYLLIRTWLISDSDPPLISQVVVVLPLAAFCGLLAAGLGLVTDMFLQGSLIGYYLAKLAREVELQPGLPPARITEMSMSISRFSCPPAPGFPKARRHRQEPEGQYRLVSRQR